MNLPWVVTNRRKEGYKKIPVYDLAIPGLNQPRIGFKDLLAILSSPFHFLVGPSLQGGTRRRRDWRDGKGQEG